MTWGHSDEKFIVVVGNIVQQRKLIFKTNDGKACNHLIHDYVKFKVQHTYTYTHLRASGGLLRGSYCVGCVSTVVQVKNKELAGSA